MQTTIELQPKREQHLARWKQLGLIANWRRDLCRGPVTVELGRGGGREARSLLRGRSEGGLPVRAGCQDNVLRARALCSLRNLQRLPLPDLNAALAGGPPATNLL